MLSWMQNTIIFAIDDTPVLDLEADNYNPVYFSTTCKYKYISFAYPIIHSPEFVTTVIKGKDSGY